MKEQLYQKLVIVYDEEELKGVPDQPTWKTHGIQVKPTELTVKLTDRALPYGNQEGGWKVAHASAAAHRRRKDGSLSENSVSLHSMQFEQPLKDFVEAALKHAKANYPTTSDREPA